YTGAYGPRTIAGELGIRPRADGRRGAPVRARARGGPPGGRHQAAAARADPSAGGTGRARPWGELPASTLGEGRGPARTGGTGPLAPDRPSAIEQGEEDDSSRADGAWGRLAEVIASAG